MRNQPGVTNTAWPAESPNRSRDIPPAPIRGENAIGRQPSCPHSCTVCVCHTLSRLTGLEGGKTMEADAASGAVAVNYTCLSPLSFHRRNLS